MECGMYLFENYTQLFATYDVTQAAAPLQNFGLLLLEVAQVHNNVIWPNCADWYYERQYTWKCGALFSTSISLAKVPFFFFSFIPVCPLLISVVHNNHKHISYKPIQSVILGALFN